MLSKRALITPLLFLLVSLLWILLSDHLVKFIASDDELLLSRLQTVKGTSYVILATIFIYLSNRFMYRSLEERGDEINLFYTNKEIALIKHDMEHRIIWASSNMEGILGYKVDEIVGRKVPEFTPEKYQQEDLDNLQGYLQGTLNSFTLEREYAHKDGRPVYVRLNGIVKRNDKGEPLYVIVVIQDLTEAYVERRKREKSEEALDNVVSLIPSVVYYNRITMDGDVSVRFISDGVKQLLGYDPREVYEMGFSKVLSKLVEGSEGEEVRKSLYDNRLEAGTTFHEFKTKDRDGDEKWLRMHSNSVKDEARGLVRRYGVISDVTLQKQAEFKLEKRVKELELLNYTSTLLQVTSVSNQKILSKIAREIPNAFRFPEKVKAVIEFGGKNYESDDRVELGKMQISVPLATNFTQEGKIRVCACNAIDEAEQQDFFCQEEKDVLSSLAEMLRNWLEKQNAEKKLRHTLDSLERMVELRTKELREAHDDITSSIDYAQRIQKTILPTAAEFKAAFPESFVFFRPKDVVSGDFYWLKEHKGLVFIACVDCTGHGVPGAMLSMIGNQLLETLVVEHEIERPDEILEEMHKAIVRLFAREGVEHKMSDGMDLSLCIIDRNKQHLSFSGAHNNAYLFRNEEVVTMKAGRHSLGGVFSDHVNEFVYESVDYQKGDLLYMSTDGFIDQFGGPRGKKFMRKNLLLLFDRIRQHTLDEQGQMMKSAFEEWIGDHLQMDDVTVVGIKL